MRVVYLILGLLGAMYVVIGGSVFLVFAMSEGLAEAGGAVFIPLFLW